MKYYILSSQENMIQGLFEKFSYFIIILFIGLVVIVGFHFLKVCLLWMSNKIKEKRL